MEVPPGARRVRDPAGLRVLYRSATSARFCATPITRSCGCAGRLSILLIALGLFVANVIFALIYYAIGGIGGARHTFFDMFSFSVQTMATIGYGVMHPDSHAASIVMIVEAIFGLILTALATGLVFTQICAARPVASDSRPTQ